MQNDELRRYLEFYQDLGVKTLYKRAPIAPAPAAAPVAQPSLSLTADQRPANGPVTDGQLSVAEEVTVGAGVGGAGVGAWVAVGGGAANVAVARDGSAPVAAGHCRMSKRWNMALLPNLSTCDEIT